MVSLFGIRTFEQFDSVVCSRTKAFDFQSIDMIILNTTRYFRFYSILHMPWDKNLLEFYFDISPIDRCYHLYWLICYFYFQSNHKDYIY
jgi:hypothetical protein